MNGTENMIPLHFGKYQLMRIISRSKLACVALVLKDKTLEKYIAKIYPRESFQADKLFAHVEQEIRVMECLDHPNIMKIIEVVYSDDFLFSIMEYCPYGDLQQYIDNFAPFSDETILYLLKQILSALSYLEKKGISHRDVKPENILVTNENTIRLTDFGICHKIEKDCLMETTCGSLAFCAPEVARGEKYDGCKADVWSSGIVLYDLVMNSLPWKAKNQASLLREVSKGIIGIPEDMSPLYVDLFARMLNIDPNQRATADELLHLPCFNRNTLPKLSNIKPSTKSQEFILQKVSSRRLLVRKCGFKGNSSTNLNQIHCFAKTRHYSLVHGYI